MNETTCNDIQQILYNKSLGISDDRALYYCCYDIALLQTFQPIPDSKVHGTNMGPTWVLSAPGGNHVGPMNLAIRDGNNMCWMSYMTLIMPRRGIDDKPLSKPMMTQSAVAFVILRGSDLNSLAIWSTGETASQYDLCAFCRIWCRTRHGPLTRYIKFPVAHALGMPG